MQLSELEHLLTSESSAVEWKRNVGDPEDVARTLVAFANDIEHQGGGVVICGVEERPDGAGSPIGLTPARLKELRGKVPSLLRDKANPPILAHVETVDLPGDSDRKILVFRVEASPHVIAFHHSKHGNHYFIRVDHHTERANGRLEELFRQKRVRPPLMEDVHLDASMEDVDLRVIRDYLERLDLPQPWETYLEPDAAIEAGIPSLVATRTTGEPAPRNFTLLLFGFEPRRFFRGACVVLSAYPGNDRSATRSELVQDVSGSLPEMIRKVLDWLSLHTGIVVDKSESVTSGLQNRPRYARRALEEAVVNAFVHRDYSSDEPVRVSIFDDRLEITSPGGLPRGVAPERLREGRAVPQWRNAALASFMLRLGMAQNRGEGVSVILKATRQLTGRTPVFDVDAHHVTVSIPALRAQVARGTVHSPGDASGDGLLLVAVGAPSIREQVRASLADLQLDNTPIVVDYESRGYLENDSGGWEAEARKLRETLQTAVERPEYRNFHLFYRGPVVLAPLIGAIVAPARPLHIYTFDNGRYVYTHTVDKKFLRG